MTQAGLTVARRCLGGALALSFAFGSLHAFGVLLEPLQRWLAADRASISLGYSLAIVSLTAGVFASRYVAILLSARQLALLCGLIGAGGLLLAASGGGLLLFLLGYGIVFGFCNGLAYNLFLERAAAAMPLSRGLAIGIATAVYGAGAAAFTQVLAPIIGQGSVGAALGTMALSVAIAGALAALAFRPAAPPAAAVAPEPATPATTAGGLARLWLVYFLGAGGGLMIIAHTTAIMNDGGAALALAQGAATLNAAGNVLGSACGGVLADRLRPGRALAVPLLVSFFAMLVLLLDPPGWIMLAMLTLCGLAYGALIAIVPVVIRARFGAAAFSRVFGIVFTAWGAAGLAGPVLAGGLHDLQGDYRLAIALAAAACIAALILNRRTGGAAQKSTA